MGGRKTLTIGITVNLEHYENLRLEVSGEVDSPQDADDLSQFLDTILGRFGTSDPPTAERISRYRKRVFPEPGCAGAELESRTEIAPNPPQNDTRQGPGAGPTTPLQPMRSAEPSLESPMGTAITCGSCGAPVTPAEQKMSQLFASRTLCRMCMKNLQIDTKARERE